MRPAAPTGLVYPYGMQQRYGWALRCGLRWLFGNIDYPAGQAERVAALQHAGTVVYVTRGQSVWLTLCFNTVLGRLGLPLASAVGGVNFAWLQPPSRLWRFMRQRRLPLAGPWDVLTQRPLSRREALLAAAVRRGDTAFVALPMPREGLASKEDLSDYVRALLVAQRAQSLPIMLAPHVLIDRGQSGAAHKSLVDRIFGDRRRPGALRHVAMLLTLRHGSLRMADPINLRDFMAEHAGQDDLATARKLRHELQRRMNEEERVVAGPRLSVYQTTARHVMRDPLVRQALAEASGRTGKGDLVLEAYAQDALRGIAARYNVRYVQTLGHLLRFVFNRIYDGIVVDEAGLARVLEAARRGPLIFCPSHRSHVDYLVLSYVLWQHRIAPPHIAAGANLAFFPLGHVFRGSGAFFLRRSFRDDPLYAAVLKAYLFELLREGTSIEFFVEGTRSRTGKLLMPKFGMLGMAVDAWRRGARADLQFVPLSIDYERIIEARSYQRELRGAEKRAEDIGGLLRTTGVLRSRYGQVQLQFGEPISLRQVADEAGLEQAAERADDGRWRHTVERLGYRILHSVALVCSVTPTAVVATALLSHAGRGMAQGILFARARDIVTFLQTGAARISPPLADPDTQVSAVLEAVQKLVDEGTVTVDRAGRGDMEPIYRVPDESRVGLDYHKNALMNYFAPAALVARAIVRRGSTPCAYAELEADSRFLSRLFKREFVYRSDSEFTTYFDEALEALIRRGTLRRPDAATVEVVDADGIAHLAGLLDSFVQAYWITARTLMDLRAFPLWHKECVNRTLERTRRAFLEGEITRPEAANQSLVETALSWLLAAGVIRTQASGRRQALQLSMEFGAEKLQSLIDEVRSYV